MILENGAAGMNNKVQLAQFLSQLPLKKDDSTILRGELLTLHVCARTCC